MVTARLHHSASNAYTDRRLRMSKAKMTFVVLYIMLSAIWSVVASTKSQFILAINEDNDHYFKLESALMTEEALVSYLDAIITPGFVTDFFMCPCGQRASYASKAWEPIWTGLHEPNMRGETNDIWCVNAKLLHDRGIDPYAVWIRRCREKKVRSWMSMRMNDVHGAHIRDYFRNTTFWRTRRDLHRHPELDRTVKCSSWEDFAFNYAHKEVRDYHFAMFKELVDRYDVDGYELDWMRFTLHLTPGRERAEAPVLTAFMRRCRSYLDKVGIRRGRRLLLSARIPTRYEAAREKGFDPEQWAREGLIDWLITTNFFDTNDFEIDVSGWKKRLAAVNPSVHVFPGASNNLRRGPDGKPPIPMSAADYARWGAAMRQRGANGFYLFNPS